MSERGLYPLHFFAALIHNDVPHGNVILEYRHPTIPGAKVDTVILSKTRDVDSALEFKFHRPPPAGSPEALPMQAGMLFADILRLLAWSDPVERYLVCVGTSAMQTWWVNQLRAFYSLEERDVLTLAAFDAENRLLRGTARNETGTSTDISKTLSKAFWKETVKGGKWDCGIEVTCVVKNDSLPSGYDLRVYRIAACSN